MYEWAAHKEVHELLKAKRYNMAMIVNSAINSGLGVRRISNRFFEISSEVRRELFSGVMCCRMPAHAQKITAYKHLTSQYLREAGVPTPKGKAFSGKSKNKALKYYEADSLPKVIKPVVGIHGKDVHLNLKGRESFFEAWGLVEKTGKDILVEEYLEGRDCRYFVVGDEVVAVSERRVPSVVGDGVKPIIQLVNEENERRSFLGVPSLKKIRLDDSVSFVLREQGYDIESVVPEGVKVFVRRNSNISTGAENVDITGDVHPDLKKLAVRACKAIPGLEYAGVDILSNDHFSSGSKSVVIEVNWDPGLTAHAFPSAGEARDVAKNIIDHVFGVDMDC